MSKELEALESIKQAHYFVDFELDVKVSEDYKKELDIIEKSLKALEIIKNKELNIYFIKRLSLEDFNFQCRYDQQLTQEEYDLLKEVVL